MSGVTPLCSDGRDTLRDKLSEFDRLMEPVKDYRMCLEVMLQSYDYVDVEDEGMPEYLYHLVDQLYAGLDLSFVEDFLDNV